MHAPTPLPKNCQTKIPTCTILSMEEGIIIRVESFENKK